MEPTVTGLDAAGQVVENRQAANEPKQMSKSLSLSAILADEPELFRKTTKGEPISLSEAEIKVLAQIRGAEVESESIDRQTIEARGEHYWNYLEDWNDAFASLTNGGDRHPK